MIGVSNLDGVLALGVDFTEGACVSSTSFFAFGLLGVERVGFDLPLAAK